MDGIGEWYSKRAEEKNTAWHAWADLQRALQAAVPGTAAHRLLEEKTAKARKAFERAAYVGD